MVCVTDSYTKFGGTQPRRVLVLFGNVPLLGQERGNIQVFHSLKRRNVDALFVTNREWGGAVIQPTLDSLGLRWTVADFVRRFQKRMGITEWLRSLWRIFRGSLTLHRLIRRYEPTHIHVFNFTQFINFLPVLAFTSLPVIYRVGDLPNIHRRIFKFLWARIIIPKVTTFVCVSKYIKTSLVALGAREAKCRIIYSEAPVRPPSPNTKDPGEFQKKRTFTVVYVGQLSRDKGIDLLIRSAIELCRKYAEVEFVLAGDYEWNNPLATELRRSVQSSGLQDRIRFIGYQNAIDKLYAIADLHVVPSVCEDALPNVVIEAKSAGVPSVVFPNGGAREIVTHGIDGYVCSDHTQTRLLEGIEYYLKSPELLSIHGKSARASLGILGINRFSELWDEVFSTN